MNKFVFIITLLTSFTLFSQREESELNFESEDFKHDNTFDGVLNFELQKKINASKNLKLSNSWNSETCFGSKNKHTVLNMKDTLWLCLEDSSNGQFVVPFKGVLTSHYGPRWGKNHSGVDISLKTGQVVKSAWNGRVRYAKFNDGGYGNLVVVRHYNGLETFYAHLSKLLVAPNQEVKAGEVIGLGGNTGHSFGAHLHFEIRFFDTPINPEFVIDFAKSDVIDQNLFVHKGLFEGRNNSLKSKNTHIHNEIDNGIETNDFGAVEMMAGVTFPVKRSVTDHPVVPVVRETRVYHKVKSGESLSRIANKNGTTVLKLCQLNALKANSVIDIGQTIRVK